MNVISTRLALVAGCAAALLVACSSTPVAPPPPAPAPAPVAAPRPAPAPAPMAAPVAAVPEYLDPKSFIATQRSVYFDFDDFTIKNDYKELVERHGRYLAAHPGVAIRVEGNTDERGSAEYNLALGQKRAQAVVGALKIAGAKDSQMEAVSWGKEKPKAAGHDDEARAQNRRADLVYPTK